MSVRSFRPVVSVATVAFAALGCYLVSLRVAAERAGLEDIETKIVLAQRDIRSLQTEIGTRGRLEQLERWNVKVLALSAPKADQFVDGGYQLARLARPSDQVDMTAPVVLAAAPPVYLVAAAGSPFHSVQDFVRLSKAGTPVVYGSTGNGNVTHLAMELYRSLTGANLTHVPYKGAAGLAPALLSGDVGIGFIGYSIVAPHARTIKLKNEDFSRDPAVVAALNADPLIDRALQAARRS